MPWACFRSAVFAEETDDADVLSVIAFPVSFFNCERSATAMIHMSYSQIFLYAQ